MLLSTTRNSLHALSQLNPIAKPSIRAAVITPLYRPVFGPSSNHNRPFSSTRPSMAPNKEWLVTLPDIPNALQARLAARPIHLKNIAPKVADGIVVLGGATLTEHPSEGQTPQMTGSVIIVKAETKEDVLELIRADEYTKQGVWDVDRAHIVAFKSAVREKL